MLFRKKIEQSCSYCLHGARLEEDLVLCCKKGIKTPDSSCRRFRYDPCKRIPPKPRAMDFRKYEEGDYSL